jgi:photosystem II stability/assembly factor-like uncharacterized protein
MNSMVALSLVASMSVGIAPQQPVAPVWSATAGTGVTARLRGLSPVSDSIAWASGSAGVVLRTIDGGASWQSVGPPNTADLQFRDIEAFDAFHAVILAIGPGELSRVYRTTDGGTTWAETFRNPDENAFYDCMAFLDHRHGLALSDPVGGRFRLLSTSDGGQTWQVNSTGGMPAALEGEFAFAASGTCLVTSQKGSGQDVWFATGGGATARVFHSGDRGRSWQATDSPVPSGPSAGIYSLAFRDPRHGLAVGGDFLTPETAPNGSAVSTDGGHTWQVTTTVPGQYRSGSSWLPWTSRTALAVGPTGSEITYDGGQTWLRFDTSSLDSVACVDRTCWASGANGRVVKFRR